MSSHAITAALTQGYIDGAFGLQTGWPNKPFTPPEGQPFAKLNIDLGETEQATMGTSGRDRNVGFMQVSLFYQQDIGTKAILEMSDLILAQFQAGKALTHSTQVVHIKRKPAVRGPLPFENLIRIDITIPFWADTLRNT